MNEINEGDIVWLKSGSPKMTVESLGVYANVRKAKCVWFDNGKPKSDLYPLHMLTAENPNAPAAAFGSFVRT